MYFKSEFLNLKLFKYSLISFCLLLSFGCNKKKKLIEGSSYAEFDSLTYARFSETGKLEYKSIYLDTNQRDEKVFFYYPNGNLQKIITLRNDSVIINEYIKFYPQGPIKSYNFYSYFSNLCYYREYNINGSLEKEEGHLFVYSIQDTLHYNIGDTFRLKLYVPTPPKCRVNVYNKVGINLKRIKHLTGDYFEYLGVKQKANNAVCQFKIHFYDSSTVKARIENHQVKISF